MASHFMPLGIFYMTQIYDMGHDGFTSPPKEGVLRILFALKNQTASAGFEPVNLGTKDQHATPRVTKHNSLFNPGQLSRYSESLPAERSGDRIPVGVRFFTPVQTRPGVHPATYTVDTVSFLEIQWPERGIENLHPYSAEVKERVDLYHYCSFWVFVVCHRVIFIFNTLTDRISRNLFYLESLTAISKASYCAYAGYT